MTTPSVFKPEAIGPIYTRIAFNVQLSASSTISFETTVDRDADIAVYNELVQKLDAVSERQRFVSALEKLKQDKQAQSIMLRIAMESIDVILHNDRQRFEGSQRSGLYRQSREATNELTNANITIARHRNMLETIDAQIAEYSSKIKG